MKNNDVYEITSELNVFGNLAVTISRKDKKMIILEERGTIDRQLQYTFGIKEYIPLLSPLEVEELRYLNHNGLAYIAYFSNNKLWCASGNIGKFAYLFQPYNELDRSLHYKIKDLLEWRGEEL